MNREERLKLVRENVEEAKLLYGEKIGTKVVFTKLYHALMYCLFALFDIRIIATLPMWISSNVSSENTGERRWWTRRFLPFSITPTT